MDIAALAEKAALYQHLIDEARARVCPIGFDWYPYDTLGNVYILAELLTDSRRDLLTLMQRGPVLDLGCGDGHMAFFLESLGIEVHAIDNPLTNFNRMCGIRLLKDVLGSNVQILENDFDDDFGMPRAGYSVVLLLGVLYHLKNPFYLLEKISLGSRALILSTRVARFGPHGESLEGLPVAYLVERDETNADATNYWIFTNSGLQRLINRAGWTVRDYLSIGNTTSSNPSEDAADERAFCFAESTAAIGSLGHLLYGWHEPGEDERWRWTERRFAVELAKPAGRTQVVLRMEFFLPENHIAHLQLSAMANGVRLPALAGTAAGDYVYEAPLPPSALETVVRVEFELAEAKPPTGLEERELGIVVTSLRLL